ncbi:MAG: ribulose-phosphate 3-epimerase [Erysipelotrichaceae bacterium]|nr:ribulose-phosphate 3-epimerase [Erysipelotrichaceae bacterium]
MIIAPSILSMDFSDTKKSVEALEASCAKWMHFDVMDGHFVPNLTFGPDILKAMKRSSSLLMDVHVMIADPMKYAPVFINAGADLYTFHYEAVESVEKMKELIHLIHNEGCKAGISIKPKTSVSVLDELINEVDLVLVMSVEPGFGGQKFDPNALNKISTLRQWIDERKLNCLIEVDGGINAETGKLCKESGVDVLVAGSYVFGGDIKERCESLC